MTWYGQTIPNLAAGGVAGSGVPLPWRQALHMPAAEQVTHLARLFEALPWSRLRPMPDLVTDTRGTKASATSDGGLIVVYAAEGSTVGLQAGSVLRDMLWLWYDPRSGQTRPATVANGDGVASFQAPGLADWILIGSTDRALMTRLSAESVAS